MQHALILMRSTMMAVLLMGFTGGCALVDQLQATIMGLTSGGSTTTTVIVCPKLELPPEPALVALERAGDPAVDAWAVELEQHYDAIERCGR